MVLHKKASRFLRNQCPSNEQKLKMESRGSSLYIKFMQADFTQLDYTPILTLSVCLIIIEKVNCMVRFISVTNI